jgi:hypothetical protein
LLIARPLALGTETVTVPSSLAFKSFNGDQLVMGADEQVVIAGPAEARPFRIFNCQDDASVLVLSNQARQTVYQEWWGIGDGDPANKDVRFLLVRHSERASQREIAATKDLFAGGLQVRGAGAIACRYHEKSLASVFCASLNQRGQAQTIRHGPYMLKR